MQGHQWSCILCLTKSFIGELVFPMSDEAKYKPLVDKIIDSCKLK